MTIQNHIGSIIFVVFGDDRGTVVDKYVLPEPVAKLIDQKLLFTVTLLMKSLEIGKLNFKIQSCKPVNESCDPLFTIRQPYGDKQTASSHDIEGNSSIQECLHSPLGK
ncbi:hypothetical protein SCA6_003808 [Theobroma cacao]